MTPDQLNFVNEIAKYVNEYRERFSIRVASPIIAQAILESNWGQSKLSKNYHNYFGLKCGSGWNGRSVNMATKEEYSPGTLTNIKSNFRVYNDMSQGVYGYFVFINTYRYKNLKEVTDPLEYLRRIKANGYATSSKYVDNCYNLIKTYNLTQYDGIAPILGSVQVKPGLTEMARRVIRGDYGNMPERKPRVEAEGWDYETVRAEVNRLYREGLV